MAEIKTEDFTPREYQVDLLEKALKKNIIVCLGTGAGKTFIGVMLIKELITDILKPFEEGGKRAFFITKTVPLVNQQAAVLRMHTSLNVGEYYGAIGVDFWNEQKWREELRTNQILVMTNQILTNIVSQSYINPDIINLLIIDECHHAVGNDPIVQLMRRFLDFTVKPKILGLTASVLNGKCKASQVENKIRKLETNLDAVVETPANAKMAALHATKPKEKIVKFNSSTIYDDLKQHLIEELQRILKMLPNEGKNEEDVDFDSEEDDLLFLSNHNIKFKSVLKDLMYLISEMGLWCAYEASVVYIEEFNKLEEKIVDDLNKECFSKVKGALVFVKERCHIHFGHSAQTDLDALQMFISNKIIRLKEILFEINASINGKSCTCSWKRCNEDDSDDESINNKVTLKISSSCPKHKDNRQLRAIIFVERRITAWVLNQYLQKISEFLDQYRFIKSDFVVGHACNPANIGYARQKATHQQKKVLAFRHGEINILVATRVVEEGMDIPTCNLIIRFDEPKDFRSYIQSKGRARSEDSYFITLINEEAASKLEDDFRLYNTIEKALYIICHERLPPNEDDVEENLLRNIIPPYYADRENKQGPAISAVDAISRINWYCQTLPQDKLTNLVPRIMFKKRSKPHNAILQFNENLEDYDFDDNESGFFDEYDILPRADVPDVIWYQAYLKFPVNSPCRDIIEGDIMETKKLAKQSVALKACEELHKAGELTNDLLPVMRDPSEFLQQLTDIREDSNGVPKPGSRKRRQVYLKQTSSMLQGIPPQPNILLFLYKLKLTVIPEDGFDLPIVYYPEISNQFLGILISKALPEVEPFPLNAAAYKVWVEIKYDSEMTFQEEEFLLLECFQKYLVNNIFQINSGLLMFDSKISNSNYFLAPLKEFGQQADSWMMIDWDLLQSIFCIDHEIKLSTEEERKHFDFNYNNYENAIVQTCYAPENYYFVSQICEDMNSSSDFPSDHYSTFDDYYRRRYNINIQNKSHPLLHVKYIHPCSNMLPLKVASAKKKKMSAERVIHNYFIPELCAIHPFPASLFLQAQYLPSILYRLNSLLLAYELNTSSIQHVPLAIQDYAVFAKWSTVEWNCRNKALENDTETVWKIMFKEAIKKEINLGYNFDQEIFPPQSIILKTLTARSCNDCFDSERLEILGDCFLKYSTSIYLYLNFPNIDEGRLTLGRSSIISNFHLYYIGKVKGIANILHTEIFSPLYNWIPPGYIVDKNKEEILIQSKLPFYAWKYVWDENISTLTPDQIWQLVTDKKFETSHKIEEDEAFQIEEVINHYTSQLIGDKIIADSIEALIGAHLLYIGPEAALRFMTWMGIRSLPQSLESSSDEIQLKPLKIPSTAYFFEQRKASEKLLANLDQFEIEIGYIFRDKSFLLQAMTHPSYNRNVVTDCYQRLEFLGDAILDYLVIWHLYMDSRQFSPGNISDLRSALVNYITFAKLAVKNNFHCYLKNLSPKLFTNITNYLKYSEMEEDQQKDLISEEEATQEDEIEVPKALCDIFESVAAAIFLDSGLSLDVVWNVYSKMMMPLIEEYSNDIPVEPVRQAHEQFPDLKFNKEVNEQGVYRATATVEGILFEGQGKTYKLAKRNAANRIIREFKKRSK